MTNILNNFRFILLLILLFLIVFSYYPTINNLSIGLDKGTILTPYIIAIFIILIISLFDIKSILKSKEIKYSFLLLMLFFFSLLFAFIFYNIDIFMNIRELLIPLFAIIVGWQLDLTNKQYRVVLYVFIILVLYDILMQIMINGAGFIIEEQYFVISKNALGVIGATSAVLSLIIFFDKKTKLLLRVLFLIIFLLLLISILTIRARTATLVTIFMVLFILFKKFDRKNVFYAILGLIIFIVIIYFLLPLEAKQYVYDSFFLNHENDITTDRMERNEKAIEFLKDNLLFGNIANKQLNFGWVHNYLLGQTVKFGIIFVFFDFLLYFYLLIVAVKNVFKRNIFDIRNVGYVSLLIPFGISMAEPSFPFGPGTATVFNFILFGISLRYNYSLQNINYLNK